MNSKINDLLTRVQEFHPKAAAEIEDFRVRMLGKKGELTALMEEFKSVAPERKRELGQRLNALKQEALAKIAKVDIETHAKNMFKAGSDFKNKTTEEIFYSDFKIFHTDEFDFGVAQISAMSREELDKVAEKLRPFLKEVLGEKRIDMVYVMLTDILEESSKVIFEGHDAGKILADAFEREENENGILLEGIVSRKKQLIPTLMNAMADKV